jgi:hypothetical protein
VTASHDDSDQQLHWQAELEKLMANPKEPIPIRAFVGMPMQTGSRPIRAIGVDGRTYIVKGKQAGRQIINDQVVGHLGVLLEAPVAEPYVVEVDEELINDPDEPEFSYFQSGLAHGSLFISGCMDDRSMLRYQGQAVNRDRFARLSVLYGWVGAADRQFLYKNQPPNVVYSVDHGHFFPGGRASVMVSRYSVIQYVPDPIAGERINLGVFVFDDQEIRVRFLDNWKRIHCFGGENVEYLRDLTSRIENATDEGLFIPDETLMPESSLQERLLKISQEWQNIVQITPPRKSLGELEVVVDEISKLFLKEPEPEAKRVLRDRQAAAKLAKGTVREVLKRRFEPAFVRELLNQHNMLPGRREVHQFDATVMNGKPYFGVQGVSFEIHPPKTTTEAVAWMIADVRDQNADVPLAVLALPPKRKTPEYDILFNLHEQKTALYRELGAIVLGEQELADWANGQIPANV